MGGGATAARSASRRPLSQQGKPAPPPQSARAKALANNAAARRLQDQKDKRSTSPFKGSSAVEKQSVVANTSLNQSAISHNQPFASPQSDLKNQILFNVTDTDILAALGHQGAVAGGDVDVEFASAHGSAIKNKSHTPFFSPESRATPAPGVLPKKSPTEGVSEQFIQVSRSVNATPGTVS